MVKKLSASALAVLMICVSLTVVSFKSGNEKTDVSQAGINKHNAGEILSGMDITGIIGDASQVIGEMGGMVDMSGIAGGVVGDLSNAVGGIIGDLGVSVNTDIFNGNPPTYNINTGTYAPIEIPPGITDFTAPPTSSGVYASQVQVGETVDFAATQNPYQKPTGELKGGDTGEGVKWVQWMFIYTRYGLKDNGITGIFDEDTVAVVKKLQKEYGLFVDGKVNDEVINFIEVLYYQSVYSTTSLGSTEPTEGTTVIINEDNVKKDSGLVIGLIIAVVVVWVVAIGFIVALFILKKKNGKQNSKADDNTKMS